MQRGRTLKRLSLRAEEFDCVCDQVCRDTDAAGRHGSEKILRICTFTLWLSQRYKKKKKKRERFLRTLFFRLTYFSKRMTEYSESVGS